MVGEGDAGPVIGKARQGFQMGADRRRIAGHQQREIVAGMQALVGRQIAAGAFELLREFAEHETVVERIHPPADHVQHRLVLFQIGVVEMPLHVGGGATIPPAPRSAAGMAGLSVSLRVVQKGVGHVQAEAVDAALQPDVQHLQRRLARRARSSSSAWAAGAGICGGNIAAAPAGRTRPGRRTPTASCWAPCRRPADRPRHTSPFSPHRRRGWRRTRHVRRRYGPAPRPG